MKRILFLLSLTALFLAYGCREDDPVDPNLPDTQIFVDSIGLTGEDRLRSTVHLFWFGTDRDGFVRGYEVSLDNQNWTFTTNTDSVFSFDISAESDTTDINFWVRAIDDQSNADPEPAYLRVPIRNTPPTIRQDANLLPRDTNYVVLTFGINAGDPDGDETLTDIEFKLNDGEWYSVGADAEIVSLVPENPQLTGSGNAQVYLDTDEEPQALSVNDYRLGQTNTIYLRATDQGGLVSKVDTSAAFYVTSKSGELLVLDAFNSFPLTRPVYEPAMSSIWNGVDYISLNDTAVLSRAGNIQFRLWIEQYDQLAWIDDPGSQDELQAASTPLEAYLSGSGNNKRLLLITALPDTLLLDNIFSQLGALDSAVTAQVAGLPNQNEGGEVIGQNGYPDITNESIFLIQPIVPFYSSTAQPVYTGNLVALGGQAWDKSTLIASRNTNLQGNVNLVFTAYDVHRLENQAGFEAFLQQVHDDFDW